MKIFGKQLMTELGALRLSKHVLKSYFLNNFPQAECDDFTETLLPKKKKKKSLKFSSCLSTGVSYPLRQREWSSLMDG